MKLYHNPRSPNARRVLLTLAYLELPYDEQVIDLAKGEQKSPEFLALNPNGAIPVLVDGDLKLWESRAIMHYLAAKKPSVELLGKTEAARFEILRWQFWDASHLARHVGTLFWERFVKGVLHLGDPDEKAIAQATSEVKRLCNILDGALKGRRYLVGNSLTLADLSIAATFTYYKELQLPVDDSQHLAPWFERITVLDAWKGTQPRF